MSRLDNKVALITGASNGIGAVAARRFVEEGAKVFLVGRSEKVLLNLRDELTHEKCDVMAGDIALEKTNQEMIEACQHRFGGLDISLINAGDRKSTRLNSSHDQISYAVFCLKKKKKKTYI